MTPLERPAPSPGSHSQCGWDAARAASGRAGVSRAVAASSARGRRRPAASSADGFVPRCPRPAATTSGRRPRAAGPLGRPPAPRLRLLRVGPVSHRPGPRAPRRPRGCVTGRAPGRGTRRSSRPARAASRAAQLLGPQPVAVAGRAHRGILRPVGLDGEHHPARAARGPRRRGRAGRAERPDVLVHDEPVGAQPPREVGQHDRPRSRRSRRRAGIRPGATRLRLDGTPGSGPPAA